jgi:hypothetical protein
LEDREVAVCFAGQFLRHGSIKKDIRQTFGGGGTTTTTTTTFDAFVAMSTQQDEADASDVVSGAAVCENLKAVGGFRHCEASLVPYNGTTFLALTQTNDHFKLGFQLGNGLYPHRIASFFSTLQRCMRMVGNSHHRSRATASASSAAAGSTSTLTSRDNGEGDVGGGSDDSGSGGEADSGSGSGVEVSSSSSSSGSGGGYRTVFVTRLDVVNLLKPVKMNGGGGGPNNNNKWWSGVDRFDAVAERKGKGTAKARLEDRVFFGKRAGEKRATRNLEKVGVFFGDSESRRRKCGLSTHRKTREKQQQQRTLFS